MVALVAASAGCHFGTLAGPVTPGMNGDRDWVLVPSVPLVRQRGWSDCGEAALEMVIRYWQPAVASADVRRELGPPDDRNGIAAGRLRAVARQRGLDAFLMEGAPSDLAYELERGRPVIVGLVKITAGRAFPHYEVVVGINTRRGRVLTADPAGRWRDVTLSDFAKEWAPARHLTMVVFPRPESAPKTALGPS